MSARHKIPFVCLGVVLGIVRPTLGDHNCAKFVPGCVSAPIGTFTQGQVESLGGVFFPSVECKSEGTCTLTKQTDPRFFCSPDLDPDICSALLGGGGGIIPTVSEWGLGVTVLLTLIAGTIIFRRSWTVTNEQT